MRPISGACCCLAARVGVELARLRAGNEQQEMEAVSQLRAEVAQAHAEVFQAHAEARVVQQERADMEIAYAAASAKVGLARYGASGTGGISWGVSLVKHGRLDFVDICVRKGLLGAVPRSWLGL